MTNYREYRPELASEGMLAVAPRYNRPENDPRMAWVIALLDGAEFVTRPTQTTSSDWDGS